MTLDHTPAHPLLAALPARLHVDPAWIDHRPDGTAFVLGETGCWLSVRDGALHLEIRVLLGVTDSAAAQAFCSDHNDLALVGRWLHDEATGVLALVADLALTHDRTYDVEALAAELLGELLSTVGSLLYYSTDLAVVPGVRCTPLIRGVLPDGRNPHDDHLFTHTHPRGRTPDAARRALDAAQQVLVIPLLDWGNVQHTEDLTVAARSDGHCLVLRVIEHPDAGWGLAVSVRVPWTGDLAALGAHNLRAASTGQHLLSRWVDCGASVEHRLFLTNAALEAAGGEGAGAAELLCELVTDLALARTPATVTMTATATRAATGAGPDRRPAVLRPVWPGDDLATTLARQTPFNAGGKLEDRFVAILDRFGRPTHLTETSHQAWLATLLPADLDDPKVCWYLAIMERNRAA